MPDVAFFLIMCVPLLAIWTGHVRKMRELELHSRGPLESQSSANLESLRRELMALRDTSTQYDMSFDSALRRLENRVANLERPTTITQEESVLEVRSGR